MNKNNNLNPFLKWAGGKRWLVEKRPDLLNLKFNRFIEPFLGSGAVYFSLRPTAAILADKNKELIETYEAIKEDWKSVLKLLEFHHSKHSKEYYYQVRDELSLLKSERAARFIYLNRTCWNGLYRVNLKGEFNVPIGTKTNVLLNNDNFEAVSKLLQNAELSTADFESTLNKACKDDFVFIDPPYTVKHNQNGFIKYNKFLFTWEDQVRLKNAVGLALERGAKVLITNANHESIQDLYKDVGQNIILSRASVIAGNSANRGKYEEMVIKCY